MIVYFPEIYPDELFYSLFSRYYVKSGCLSYAQMTDEFFENPKERLDFIFVNRLKLDVVKMLTKDMSWKQTLMEHTLFPYYSRFLSADRKMMALKKLEKMEGDYANLLSLTPNRRNQVDYLRYCPLCVTEHRQKYGETYWSRIHQIPEITVCPIHGCKLLDSDIKRDKHKTKYFCSAETAVGNMKIECGTSREIAIAKYLYEILNAEVYIEDNTQVGKFLISRLANTKYLSNRGQIINIGLLYQDLMSYYENSDVGIQKEWQLSKVLHGERINPYEIAQVGLFLNIPVADLIKSVLPDKAPEELFDETVLKMIEDGVSMYKIAEKFDVSPTLIRLIAKNHGVKSSKHDDYATNELGNREERIQTEREFWLSTLEKYPGLSYSKLREIPECKVRLIWLRRNDVVWTSEHFPKASESHVKEEKLSKLDAEYFPKMEQIIEQYREKKGEKPKRITVHAISPLLGLKHRELYQMPKCRAVIEKHCESWEQYWARVCIWAADIIDSQGMRFNWKRLHDITHIKKENIMASIPYIKELDAELAEKIESLIT